MIRHVLHLVGSPTNDFYRALSELYARCCIDALGDPHRYAFTIVHVSPDGGWRFPVSLDQADMAAASPCSFADAVARIGAERIDVALPQLFCTRGMTDVRALLDLMAIPYLGNLPLQMGIAADKALTRAIVAAAGVAVPAARLLHRGDPHDAVSAAGLPAALFPVVVKPATADNSDGVALARDAADYAAAVDAAFGHADAVLVEAYVPLGREVRCGVVDRGGVLVCLPLEEYFVDEAIRPIRRSIDKLSGADATLSLAAKNGRESWIVATDDPVVPAVWAAAMRSYRALGCRQYGLFDFRIDPAGTPWFLEAGLYCSFAPHSVIVTMMAAAGTPLDTFFADAVAGLVATAPDITDRPPGVS